MGGHHTRHPTTTGSPVSDALFSEVTKAELAHRGWRMVKDRIFGVVMAMVAKAGIALPLTVPSCR